MNLLRRAIQWSYNKESSSEEWDYLTVVAEEDLTLTIRNSYRSTFTESVYGIFSISINNSEWVAYSDDFLFEIEMLAGDEVRFKAININDLSLIGSIDESSFAIFTGNRFRVKGTPMSLIYGDDFKGKHFLPEYEYALTYLFADNTADFASGLTKIENPKTFLPATTLSPDCYSYMFSKCENLINAPELPATTLANACYMGMFSGCTSLVNAPELPATTLADVCYAEMFLDCTSLTQAPELPAIALVDSCYFGMFFNCTNLNYIKMLATDIPPVYCLEQWVYGVSPTGIFVKSKDATWDVVGVSGVPTGWTVITDDQEGDSGSGLEFPLYLEFGNCEESWVDIQCTREADEIGVKLYKLLTDVCVKYGEGDSGILTISEQILDMLGIEIYLDNLKVTICNLNVNNNYIELRVSADIWADLFSSGSMNKTTFK